MTNQKSKIEEAKESVKALYCLTCDENDPCIVAGKRLDTCSDIQAMDGVLQALVNAILDAAAEKVGEIHTGSPITDDNGWDAAVETVKRIITKQKEGKAS